MKILPSKLWLIAILILHVSTSNAQDIGATFCWHYNEIYGGHDYPFNRSIVTRNLPTNAVSPASKWEGMTQWWENMVEEVDYAGLDFVAMLSRGSQPNQTKDLGMGDVKHIPTMVKYMKERNVKFKLAIFDDCPNSWTSSRNYNLYAKDNAKYELFDCGNPDNYKYIWDYNLKLAIQNIPDEMRYKINNRPVIIFWSVKSTWMTNIEGNLSKIVTYIKDQSMLTFGFTPYLIVMQPWFDRDKSLTPAMVDAAHNWFSAAGGTSFTVNTINNFKAGCCVPSFVKPSETTNELLPGMGTADMGTRLKYGLNNTVKAGAKLTLVEGFTDAAEGAALWRSGDKLYYNYPNQRLNILRSYSKNPFPDTLKVEFEACDEHSDISTGNSGTSFLNEGNLDVVKSSDKLGGWHITNTQANEWMEWKEMPLLKETKLQLRYKSTAAASVKFAIDNVDLQTVNLSSTNNAWTTVDAGVFSRSANGLNTVRMSIVSGTPDINYFLRVANNTTAIHEIANSISQNSVSVYPNPFKAGKLAVNLTGFENQSGIVLKISNLVGQLIYENNLSSSNSDVYLPDNLKAAIYIVSVESQKKKAFTRLIIR